ncbi:MAG: hypothetical protein HRT53_08205 [Colwellia sp.]|nr:hypothetical protein [Colwellia sp.]
MTRLSNIPDIAACPQCKQLYSQPRLLSFNDLYDSFYLDGYTDSCVSSLFTILVQCDSCDSVFNRKELIHIDANDVDDPHRETLKRIEQAGIEQHYQSIIFSTDNTEVELKQRLELMWEFNHPFRSGYCDQEIKQAHHLKYSAQAKENELRLLSLLSDSEEHIFIKADILRRQKRFDEAKQVFRQVVSPESQNIRGLLSILCTRNITSIVDTNFDVDLHITKCLKIDKDRYYLDNPQNLRAAAARYLTFATSSRFSFKELIFMSSFTIGIIYAVYLFIT